MNVESAGGERLTEIEKAEALLYNTSIRVVDIEKATGIGKLSISNYRKKITRIREAKWKNVKALADFYDDRELKKINVSELTDFVSQLSLWFQASIQSKKTQSLGEDEYAYVNSSVLEEMRDIILKDDASVLRLLTASKKGKN